MRPIPGRAATLGPDEVAARLAAGRRASLRFRSEDGSDDHVLRRSDGVVGYQLAVVVDDADQGVNHVLRGDDLAASTPRQIELWRALGLGPPPRYLHVPLVLDRDGRRLGKRHGSLSMRSVLDAGTSPEQLVGWLAWSAGIVATPQPVRAQDLIGSFREDALTREPTLLGEHVLGVGRLTRLQSFGRAADPKRVNMAYDYELLSIGCGPAGQRAAIQTAKLGRRVAVVERPNHVGGVCTNTGTMPSKTLRAAALDLTGLLQKDMYGDAYRVKTQITIEDLFWRTRRVIDRETEVIRDQLSRNHVDLLTGTATLHRRAHARPRPRGRQPPRDRREHRDRRRHHARAAARTSSSTAAPSSTPTASCSSSRSPRR